MPHTPPLFGRLRRIRRREDLAMVRRVCQDATVYGRFDIRPAFWDVFVFFSLTLALSAVAFLGRPPHAPIVQAHQRPKFTFEAPFDYTYQSESALKARQQLARLSVLPVFRVDTDTVDLHTQHYREFVKALAASRESLLELPHVDRVGTIRAMPAARILPGPSNVIANAATEALERAGSAGYLEFIVNDSLQVFDDLCRRGIYDERTFGGAASGDSAMRLLRRDSQHREVSVIEARRTLFNNIYYQVAGDVGPGKAEQENARALAKSIAEILHPALTANIRMDMDATSQAREAAATAVAPVLVEVKAGAPLIERDVEVDSGTLERWRAFRAELIRRETVDFGLTRTFISNSLWGVAIMALVSLYSRVAAPPGPRKKRAMSLVALAVVLNLLLLRGLFGIAEFGFAQGAGEALQWSAPFALAPLLVVVLAGPHMAFVAALLVSCFAAAMHGNSLQVLLASLLASLLVIRVARGVRLRGRIVSAGVLSSIPVALIAFYDNATPADWLRIETFTVPAAALLSGLLTGVLVAGIMPWMENLFKTTTDITLLELTDYNHPLLRKLQILAPGTFHHSVMVANLAERAAGDIGANALFCRCAALYHDIGKMAKPEYFIENKRPGQDTSPHTGLSPSMSALVIKSHVREGVEIAREYRLPRIIVDIIEQHHGTGLISYFYHKACKAAESESCRRLEFVENPELVAAEAARSVDETSYRYDGPKPKTREAAVILLSDSVEAASRSLRKVTPQSVEELVDTIVADRIADGQLDDCPLTFREIRKLRRSLRDSLLTGLHQRVEYPAEPSSSKLSKVSQVTREAGV